MECKLVDKKASSKLKRTVAYLLLCLVSNNSAAQALINGSHCLDALLDIFRSEYPGYNPSSSSPDFDKSGSTDGSSIELWKAVTSTLIGCVNNPQNESNQRECSSIFPVALNILSHTNNPQVIRILASFLSLTADNNGRNQDRLGMLGGMDIIVNSLQTVVETLLQEPTPDGTDAAMQLASLLVSCVTHNRWNKSTLADLKVVPLLVQLLALDVIEIEVKLKIVLTLGHLTESCESSQRQLVESDGLGLIVHTMTGQHNEEFTKAATYLLHTCVRVVNSSDEAGLVAVGQKAQPPITPTLRRKHTEGRSQSIPATKPQVKRSKKSTDIVWEEESVVSVTLENKDIDSKATQEVDSEVQTELEMENAENNGTTIEALYQEISTRKELELKLQKEIQARENVEAEKFELEMKETELERGNAENNGTTIEALYQEISTRKELELKLQKEIQAREDVEAEKLELEKKEEEWVMTETVSKQKAEALTKELERQCMMTVDKQGLDVIEAQTSKKAQESSMDTPKSAHKEQVKPTTPSSNSEVLILEKKVEELQKQLQEHITHNSEQSSTLNQNISSASVISTRSLESQSTIAGPMSPSSNSLSHRRRKRVINSLEGKGVEKRNGSLDFKIQKKEKKDSTNSPQSVDICVSSRKSRQNMDRSPVQALNQSQKTVDNKRRKTTPNMRRATKPQMQESVFRLPLSTINSSRKASTKSQTSHQASKQSDQESFNKKRSPTPRPTYAESVLPYKQQKYGSPLVLPKHTPSSTSNDEDDDLESIITDLTDSYSVADSGVTWSDVMLKLPVRPVGRRSNAHRNRGKSKQHDEKPNSLWSSQSGRSKRSFRIKYRDSQPQLKEKQSYAAETTPSSTTSVMKCPGCDPPIHRPLLTSRNFLYTLERSRHTCPEHREMQKAIKQDIEKRKKLQGKMIASQPSRSAVVNDQSVDGYGHRTPNKRTASLRSHTTWTPKSSQMEEMRREQECTPKSTKSTVTVTGVRRKRQDFSQEEINNLIAGVKKSGKHWNFILWSYRFKPGRTAVDLKDKYRRMQAQRVPGVLPRSPAQRKSKRQIQWN